MRTIEEMENEQLVIVIKVKYKLNIEYKFCIKAQICINIYRDLETIKAAVIMGLWHMELIGPVKPMLKGDKGITVTGEDGKIYGEPFKDKFHTRLRFCRRDLIAMANAGKDDNGSQLFFTNNKPLYPPRLIKPIILNNLFSDITPRIIVQESEEVKDNFNFLSFGGEAKEDEEKSAILNKKFTGKGKSVHDHLTDPKLSSQPDVEPSGLANK
ncbi:Peptidyl-prolyl cis-trans isomerase CWC27 like protein [Eufriesea mexicana]|uniref:Peptidyl-prolyl cis-trans isomerase CWC27 like protein n=1 Tax=Eufriesea mexicana TaxID=516756 RepID=A0A310SMR8_9HYME|nr:Peptidyl-prolyl cis-trans isomerase CWC27 like protein [Eufriesea mexicana]